MTPNEVTATFYGATDTGRKRTNNEDSYIACEIWGGRHLLLAAIDGIGGYEGGEVAAEIARSTITDDVSSRPGSDCLELLKQAVTHANNAIVEHKSSDPDRSQMGCVISSAIISLDERRIYMVHVGDSRLYQYTATDGLHKLSHDHSLVGYREEIGMLTEQEAMNHPQRNIIERSLGDDLHSVDDPNFLDAGIFPIFGPTQYLFCSDGLSDMVYSAQITSVLSSEDTAENEVTRLIAMANEAGGKDNITAVVAKIDMPAAEPEHEEPVEAAEVTTQSHSKVVPLIDRSGERTAVKTQTAQSASSAHSAPSTHSTPSAPKKKMTTGRFRALVITISVSFIVGGTAGFFIGRYTAEQEAAAAAAQPAVTPDSVVNSANVPDSTIVDPKQVGENLADSLNKRLNADTTGTAINKKR